MLEKPDRQTRRELKPLAPVCDRMARLAARLLSRRDHLVEIEVHPITASL
jgi:hypothetical protein